MNRLRVSAIKEEYVPSLWRTWREGGYRNGGNPPEPVDALFVQGLASNYENTWTKTREDGSKVMWLRDLLPQDLPDARILTFEYDSQWLNKPALVSLRDCADRLLESIASDRTHQGEQRMCDQMARRPLLLVGHSFGGLVIKMALVRAAFVSSGDPRYEDYRSTLNSVTGVIFLGTPHDGSNFAVIAGKCASFWARMGYGTNPELLALLKPLSFGSSNSTLRELDDDFRSIQRDKLKGLLAYYFWETKTVTVLGWDVGAVVSKDSACYGAAPESRIALDTEHRGMNKFGSREDDSYYRVCRKLAEICQTARVIADSRWGVYQYAGRYASSDLKQLHEWLRPVDVTEALDRLHNSRLQGTCEWATTDELLRGWIDPDYSRAGHPVWIYGKPGSGKSVLASFLYEQAQKAADAKVQHISCAGVPEQTCESFAATRRCAVLYVPLQSHLAMTRVVTMFIDKLLRWRSCDTTLQQFAWEFHTQHPELSFQTSLSLLIGMLRQFDCIYVIMDGLDECINVQQALELVQNVSVIPGSRVLVTSQPAEYISTELRYTMNVRSLDLVKFNPADVTAFIQHELSTIVARRPQVFTESIQRRILVQMDQKAGGMFQWAKLVLHDLKSHGQSEQDVLRILDQFPIKLSDAYTRTFSQMSALPHHKQKRTATALKWLLATKRPLDITCLRFAVELQEHKELFPDEDCSQVVTQIANRPGVGVDDEHFFEFLAPLVAVQVATAGRNTSTVKTIQLCHHSLRQWMEDHVAKIGNDLPFHDSFLTSYGAAHREVAVMCLWLLSSEHLQLFFRKSNRQQQALIQYAAENWSHHVLMAHPTDPMSTSRDDLLLKFQQFVLMEIKLTATVVAALSHALRQIPLRSVGQLLQVVAVRDMHTKLLDASKCLNRLYDLTRALDVRADRPTKSITNNGALKETLNENLEIAEITALMDTVMADPTHLGFRSYIDCLRNTSQALRRVSIFVAIEPLRSFVYGLTEDRGVNPILLLAHASHTLDIFAVAICSDQLARFDRVHFRNYKAFPDHPMYGPITATRYELETRRTNIAGEEFYEIHILKHYRVRSWERFILRLTVDLAMLNTNPASHTTIDVTMRHWLRRYARVRSTSPRRMLSEVVAEIETQNPNRESFRFKEVCIALVKLLYLYVLRLLSVMSPRVEQVLTGIIAVVQSRGQLAIPLVRGVLRDRQAAAAAVGLYAIRMKLFPTFLSALRSSPWIDLKGVFADPFDYETMASNRKWSETFLLIIVELCLNLITFLDATQILHPELAPYLISPPLIRLAQKLGFRSLNGPVTATLMNFWRLIFLERTINHVMYLAYDAMKATAMIMRPRQALWFDILCVHFSFTLSILGRYFTPVQSLILLVLLSGCVEILPHAAVSAGLPPAWLALGSRWFLHAISLLWWPIAILASKCRALFSMFLIIHTSSPRMWTLFGAAVVILLLCALLYIMLDPLQLRYAGGLSKRAEAYAKQTAFDRPFEYLNWRDQYSFPSDILTGMRRPS